jgi:hypothetical protein
MSWVGVDKGEPEGFHVVTAGMVVISKMLIGISIEVEF